MSKTVQITSKPQLDQLLKSSQVVVVDFFADWCGPCKQIAPVFERLSEALSRPNIITFVKINTDEQQTIARQYGVAALPTFIIFENGQATQNIKGADIPKLQRAVADLARIAGSSAAAGESSGSGSASDGWRSAPLPRGYEDVTDQVDVKGLEIMNADDEFGTVRTLIESSKPSALDGKEAENGKKDWVESDTDEQLMLFMPFQAMLKIHTLQITSIPPTTGDDLPMRPKTISIFTNRPHIIGFDEADDIPATQTIETKESDWDATGTANLPLRFVKFQNVISIVVFVSEGHGDGDKVRLDRLRIIGETGEKRDQGQLKKIDHDE